MPIHDKYRTFWPRYWAGVIDGLVLLPLGGMSLWFWYRGGSAPEKVTWLVLATFGGLAYSIVLHAIWGQTLGKRLMGIRVLDVSGNRLSVPQAFMRDLIGIVLALWGFPAQLDRMVHGFSTQAATTGRTDWLLVVSTALFAAELATMLTNPKRRAVHDFLAGSVVVRLRKR
jgi:uncharacterized RDD family membrane protein YckC